MNKRYGRLPVRPRPIYQCWSPVITCINIIIIIVIRHKHRQKPVDRSRFVGRQPGKPGRRHQYTDGTTRRLVPEERRARRPVTRLSGPRYCGFMEHNWLSYCIKKFVFSIYFHLSYLSSFYVSQPIPYFTFTATSSSSSGA